MFALTGALAAAPKPADTAKTSATLTPDGGRIVVDVQGVPPAVPLFFSAAAEQTVRLSAAEITGELRLKLHVVQGKPEVLALGLSGEGEVTEVSGEGLASWAVRQVPLSGKRFLDLRPALAEGAPLPRDLDLVVRTRLRKPTVPGAASVLIAAPGDAVGFASTITLQADAALDLRVTAASGLVALGEQRSPRDPVRFQTTGEGALTVRLTPRGAAPAEAELLGAQLSGKINETAKSAEFRLRAQLRSAKAGARLPLLKGSAAPSDKAAGDGWHLELAPADSAFQDYELVTEREGALAVDLPFAAAIREAGEWRVLDFSMPAGAVVPIQLDGLPAGVSFDPERPVLPVATAQGWQGFLPADGATALAWKHAAKVVEGALFFTSSEQTDSRLGAGLLRQEATLALQILQGKLTALRIRLDGPGEIVGVEGANLLSWRVVPAEGARALEVQFSRPIEQTSAITVRSQTELGGFPIRVEPLRLSPEGVVRHSGFLRVANDGAVRLEVAEASGMMQLAPEQYPTGELDDDAVRQVFVYRFPAATYSYRLLASQIQPEVGVSAILTYELGETDRTIAASLELDIREAPLRDWTLQIPADYTVVGVTGGDVSDFIAESTAVDGRRALKVLFAEPVEGRQLLQLRLEKNQAAAAGEWALPALRFPGAKSVRGHIGAVATPGYRLVPAGVDKLVEVPLSYFPQQTARLQQAWRLRDAEWSAALKIEALGQSVQADVFHLYTVKEGVVYGSVLLNYFVVGAPATEWRLAVPAEVGNIDVVGQNVRRDWRREGDQLVVSLHQPVLGAATLLVTFEQPMSARGGTIQPGQVRPLGVQAERGYVQVVSPAQVKHEIRKAEGGLLKLEPLELPTEFRLLTSSPSLALYQYTARPFALEVGVEWYDAGETVDQVVDFAKLSSQISRDGQVVTDAQFFVKTRGRKALRLELPAGAKLWEARVDNEIVNARADGNQTLVPLPAKLNPNDPVAVALRLGQAAGGSATIKLVAPRTVAPSVINEWTLHADSGRLLAPRGGNAELLRPALTETGFEWIAGRGVFTAGLLLAFTALGALLARGSSRQQIFALILFANVTIAALLVAASAMVNRRSNIQELTYAATMVPAEEAVTITVLNGTAWQAMVSWWGVVAVVVGAVVTVGSRFVGRANPPGEPQPSAHRGRFALPVGVALVSAGLLAQHGGAIIFYGWGALAVWLLLFMPTLGRWNHDRRERQFAEQAEPPPVPGGESSGSGAASVLPLVALLGALAFGFGAQPAQAQNQVDQITPTPVDPALAGRPAQSAVQTWTIREDRLYGELELTVRGGPGDSFLLLRPPAVLTEFKADGLRLGKSELNGQTSYFVAPEREGLLTARVRFELPVPKGTTQIVLPTGAAATQRVTVALDQGGWEFASPAAVQVVPTPNLGDARSGATLVLAPQGAAVVQLLPKRRDLATEATQFFAETTQLFLPGPGVVNGRMVVSIRPVQGRVSSLVLDVPAGLTVGTVEGDGTEVSTWRFDPEKRRLAITLASPQERQFRVGIETQLGTGALPFDLTLTPLRVVGAAGDVGTLALAFGGDAQPESVRASGLSPVNTEDFDPELIPETKDGEPSATLQHVWRFGQGGGSVSLKIAPVAPEVRVVGRQVLSLDDDRLVMAVDLAAEITRVGLFKLSFVLPVGLEVEALSGKALSHWTEAQEGNQRVVTLHLNGRTIGDEKFTLTLAGAAPRAQEAWPIPHLQVREATRQTGEALVVPGKGLRLRAVEREKVTQLDPRQVGGLQPGTLAFRLLQEDWSVKLGIEALEPWVTVQALQETTVREGQTLVRLALRYRVENAAVKQFRVKLPGLGEERARTVRATGAAVSDMVRVAGSDDTWEIRLQRGIAGETDVQIEFQGPSTGDQKLETVAMPEFVGVRQAVQFAAVRAGGRLELETGALPRGWSRTDWSAVPAILQNRTDRSVPALCFRVAEAEGPLPVAVRRHEVAEALKLRVTQGDLTTLFSPAGACLTAVDLRVDVLEKSTLRVRLPEGARLFNTLVNGESVSVVREGDAFLFHVTPNTAGERSAAVRLVYSAPGGKGGDVGLVGPRLNVPLENVTWRVVIPPGYELESYGGGLRLREERYGSSFGGLEQYQSSIVSKRSAESKKAVAMMQEASSLLQKGDQQKASEVLSRAYNTQALDEAANEDARVQLRNLKTQQTVLGLNTRRQRLYLDNRVDAARNEQLEQAASLNPFMQGNVNFNPQQVDQLLMGNSADENTALRGIADRLVDQQLAAEPAPRAIDVTLTERGRVFTFTRSLQVEGDKPLQLTLDLARTARPPYATAIVLLLAIAGIAIIPLVRRK
ncbi:MAG: hypothetical protein QM691_12005 [Opitutaceae bacterium]